MGYGLGGGFERIDPQAQSGSERGQESRKVARERENRGDPFEGFAQLLSGGGDGDIWKIVSRLPLNRIPDALERLKEMRERTPGWTPDAFRLLEIESALYFRWAESAPEAALADVEATPIPAHGWASIRRRQLRESLMAAWMRSDPDAAYRAVKDDPKLEYMGRSQLVRTWTPADVFENLKRYPKNHQLLLGWYCAAAAEDPVKRAATLQALKEQPGLRNRETAYELLFRSWGYNDFEAAMAEARSQELPAMVSQLLHDNVEQSPQKVLPWAATHDVSPENDPWVKGYAGWLASDAPAARQWFSEQAPRWESQGHSETVAGFLLQDVLHEGSHPSRSGQESSTGKLTELLARWRSKDPQAASRWLDSAPAAARDLIGKGAEP